MPKGGARIASDKFVVSKAMGFEYFYEVLKYLNDYDNKFFEIDENKYNIYQNKRE